MPHVLIIESNMAIGNAIRAALEAAGFSSFEQAWNEDRAIANARVRPPDLLVIGDELDAGSSLEAARRICQNQPVPVLMVTGNPQRIREATELCSGLDGPFLLNQIDEAVALACDHEGQHAVEG